MNNRHVYFSIITDIHEAEKIWNALSPHAVIDDEWEFRVTFFKSLGYTLYFCVAYDDNQPVMLLPLQENTGKKLQPPYRPEYSPFLEVFGGDDTDDNWIFMKSGYESVIDQLLARLPKNTVLAPLAHEKVGAYTAEFYTNKYLMPINDYNNYENYIDAMWSGSSKKKLRQQIRGLYSKYTVEVRHNQYEDIEKMFDLNMKRFGDRSSFSFAYRRQIFKDFMKNFRVEIISILVNGIVESVSYGIIYKGVYIGMNAGTNNDISDLGKLQVLLQIDRAIMLKCTLYDAGKGSSRWKEEFHFESLPQYKLYLE